MKRLYFILLAIFLVSLTSVAQQIVTTEPALLQEDSKDVKIIYHADQGNKGLMGLTASTPVYAHIGVITNKSNGNWAYAPRWLDNSDKYRMTYVSANTWSLTIGDIRRYFGINDPDEHVERIAMVFRNADGSREGKTALGGDIFVNVLADGFVLDFSSDASLVLSAQKPSATFTALTTRPARIELFYDDVNSSPIASADNATSLVKECTFSRGDYHMVIARAVCDGETLTQQISICYPPSSKSVAYPGGVPPMGATLCPDGSVTFCIAAPGKTDAIIIPSWCNYTARPENVMNYTDIDGIRYFWCSVSGLDATTDYPYYYLVDGSLAVGDPYARLVLDPFNDKWLSDGTYPGLMPYPSDQVTNNAMLAVYNGARDSYPWRVDNFRGVDQQHLVIYELLLRDFTGTEGKAYGDGTLKLAMQKLDYLQELGVNAIELMPIQEFNGNNSWGYNTNFYFAPDKAYGSPDDYRAFIDECHSRGIAVILDVVFNQSDGLHPWYMMYPSGSNPFYNARAPHAYSVLNDWNQDNLLVQQQWTDMIRYWMTAYRVDGFRFDLVKGLGDNESYGGNASETNTNKYNASRVARMKRLTEVMHSINPYAYSINENLAGAQEENDMAANGQLNWANINNASCQFAMGYKSDSNCNRFYAPLDSRTWGSTVSYAESHDEQRVAYKQDQWAVSGVKGNVANSMRRLGIVAAQMLLSPGAHMIWQFGELGNGTNTKNSNGSNNTDPKPVLWNYFDDPNRHGLYESYSQLIGIRNANHDLFDKDAYFKTECGTNNWENGRYIYASTSTKELICVVNPENSNKTFTGVIFASKSNSDYHILSSSYGVEAQFDASAGTVTLAAGSYVVIANLNVSAIDDVMLAEPVMMSVAPGTLNVAGDFNNIYVYTPAGQCVYVLDNGKTSSSRANIPLASGLYIVVIDGTPHKILIK